MSCNLASHPASTNTAAVSGTPLGFAAVLAMHDLQQLLTHRQVWINLPDSARKVLTVLVEQDLVNDTVHQACWCGAIDAVSGERCRHVLYLPDDCSDENNNADPQHLYHDRVCGGCGTCHHDLSTANNRRTHEARQGQQDYHDEHYPQYFTQTTVTPNFLGLTGFIEALLRAYQLTFSLASDGVYHVMGERGLMRLVFVDRCDEPRYLSVNAVREQATVLLYLRADVSRLRLSLLTLSVVDVLHCPSRLMDYIEQAWSLSMDHLPVRGVDSIVDSPAMYVVETVAPQRAAANPEPTKPTKEYHPHQDNSVTSSHLRLEVRWLGRAISINNVIVISHRAYMRFFIFKVLFEHYWENVQSGCTMDQHGFLSVDAIANALTQQGLLLQDVEQGVRRRINKLQKNIQRKLSDNAGLTIQQHSVIQSSNSTASTHASSVGYRLNPHDLAFC